MCFEKLSPFPRMIVGAVLGILLGIFFGLLFGLLIAWITQQIATSSPFYNSPEEYSWPAFLGMGFGAIIGAILGAHCVRKS